MARAAHRAVGNQGRASLSIVLVTVLSDSYAVEYIGNGASAFAIPFPFLASAHVVVTHRDAAGVSTTLVEGAHYTVTDPAADDNGATVALITEAFTLPVGDTLRLERRVPYTQPTDFLAQGLFLPETHEAALDRLEMQIQQIRGEVAEAIGDITWGPVGRGGGFAAVLAADAAGVGPTDAPAMGALEYNDGAAFDLGGTRFTAPVAGRWRLSVQVEVTGLTQSDAARVDLYKNGVLVARGTLGPATVAAADAADYSASSRCDVVLQLSAGDYVDVLLAVQTDQATVTLKARGSRIEGQLLGGSLA